MASTEIRKKTLNCLLSLSLLLSQILISTPVQAIGGSGLAAYPANPDRDNPLTESWFIYNLDRGESKQDALMIRNDSEESIALRLYVVDSTTNNVGEFSLESETSSKDEMGLWVELETDSLSLEPGEEKQVNFTITIPRDARSGEVSGGIIVQKELTEEQNNQTSGFVINTRLGIRIYETVPGEIIQKVIFEDASLEYNEEEDNYILNVLLKNESNVSVKPAVKAQVKDAFFDIQNQTVEQTVTIPRDSEASVSLAIERPKIGKFEVTPEVSYQKQDGAEETITNDRKLYFWTLPWDEIIIVTLLLLANILFLIVLKIISRKEKKYYKSYKVKGTDNLEKIAEKLGTDWKKIAKINKLKPPYQLVEGQIITVFDKKDMLEQLYMENEKIEKEIHSAPDGTFDKDLSEIYEDDGFFSQLGKKLGIRKDICVLLIAAMAFAGIGYICYINISLEENNSQFIYENAKVFEEDKEEEATQEELNDTTQEEAPTEEDDTQEETEEDIIEKEITRSDREQVSIEVLNGSGTKGASSSAAAILQEAGYSDIATGNADNFNHTTTLILHSSIADEMICEDIKRLLADTYTEIEIGSDEDLEENDVQIILGK